MPNPVMVRAIEALVSRRALSAPEAAEVLREVMEGRATEIETAGFLVALRAKGETVDEIVGLARTMRELATPVRLGGDDLLDTAGTGGGRPTFNVSTTAAFVAAGAGCRVAKHGNRSATGRSGSADLLEALGARIDLAPEAIAECVEEVGFGFMFAPSHHGATRHVVPVRRALGVRTVFNFLGPLTNPAGATRQLIGVSDPAYLEPLAAALAALGGRSALIVSSEDGLDEISVSAPTRAVELKDGGIHPLAITPEGLGVERAHDGVPQPADPAESAQITRALLSGQEGPGRSLVLLNAGAAIYVAGGAGDLSEGVLRAAEAVDSGAALDRVERFVSTTRRLGPS